MQEPEDRRNFSLCVFSDESLYLMQRGLLTYSVLKTLTAYQLSHLIKFAENLMSKEKLGADLTTVNLTKNDQIVNEKTIINVATFGEQLNEAALLLQSWIDENKINNYAAIIKEYIKKLQCYPSVGVREIEIGTVLTLLLENYVIDKKSNQRAVNFFQKNSPIQELINELLSRSIFFSNCIKMLEVLNSEFKAKDLKPDEDLLKIMLFVSVLYDEEDGFLIFEEIFPEFNDMSSKCMNSH